MSELARWTQQRRSISVRRWPALEPKPSRLEAEEAISSWLPDEADDDIRSLLD